MFDIVLDVSQIVLDVVIIVCLLKLRKMDKDE